MTDAGSTPAESEPPGSMHSLLEEIVASSNDAIVGKDLNGIVTSWNAAAERLFGYGAADMIGQPITRIIPADRLGEEAAILDRIRRGERLSHFETVRLTSAGECIEVSVTISPIRDTAGHIVGASKIARDLSQVHRLTAELQQRGAVLQSILDTVPDALIVIDRRGTIQSFSPAAERMFGYVAAEVQGENVRLLMPAADAGAHDRYMARYLETGEQRIIGVGRVLAGRRRDGTEFPMELQVGEVRLDGTRLFTGFARDLTERRERERRFAEMQAELIHISRLSDLGQMVSALAHEVNQPLTAISNYLRGMRRLLAADPASLPGAPMTGEAVPDHSTLDQSRLAEAVEKAAVQAARAHDIVQSLRGMVKKEARPRQVESLTAMVRETGSLAMLETRSGINPRVHIPPAADAVLVDRVQIQQVLLNLLRNAADAMAGRPVRRITVSARQLGDRVELRIADTGPGLPEAVRSRLFEPFVTTKPDGLGVGLSICRTIVEAHGGELTAESEPNQGAVFRFTLPRAAGNDSAEIPSGH